jgi:uncharacterized membrane protein YfhO
MVRASYRGRGTQGGVIEVDSPAPAIVLVRTTFHRNWRASVDGHTAPVLAADYVDVGIPVPAGRHTIALTYHDPWVGAGLFGSAITLAFVLCAALVLRRSP